MLEEYWSATVGAVSPLVVERRLLGWISRYGLQAIFGLQVLGIVGLPVPDELLLTIAGTLVRAGKLPLVGTLAAAMSGAMVGITVSYLAGRFIGLAALRKVVHLPDEALRRVEHWFHRAGGWLLTFGYFIPGVRHVTAIAAGSSGLGYGTFASFAYPGAIFWSTFFVTAGYLLGDRWHSAFEAIRWNMRLVILVAALAYGLYLAFVAVRWYRRERAPRPPVA
jgi:membrane protein DedA with SNARE-associated domain